MILCNEILCYVLILFCFKVTYSTEVTKRTASKSDGHVHNTFAKLLKSIVRVNEERLDAVKKITELQDYMLTKNRLKPDEDAYDSLEDDEHRAVLAFRDFPLVRRTDDETIKKHMCNKLFPKKNNRRLLSKQFFKQACHRQSIDYCVNACTKSVENVCENYYCNKTTRRDFRTECHDNCRNIFEYDEEQDV